jgi:hypothetical protein
MTGENKIIIKRDGPRQARTVDLSMSDSLPTHARRSQITVERSSQLSYGTVTCSRGRGLAHVYRPLTVSGSCHSSISSPAIIVPSSRLSRSSEIEHMQIPRYHPVVHQRRRLVSEPGHDQPPVAGPSHVVSVSEELVRGALSGYFQTPLPQWSSITCVHPGGEFLKL